MSGGLGGVGETWCRQTKNHRSFLFPPTALCLKRPKAGAGNTPSSADVLGSVSPRERGGPVDTSTDWGSVSLPPLCNLHTRDFGRGTSERQFRRRPVSSTTTRGRVVVGPSGRHSARSPVHVSAFCRRGPRHMTLCLHLRNNKSFFFVVHSR